MCRDRLQEQLGTRNIAHRIPARVSRTEACTSSKLNKTNLAAQSAVMLPSLDDVERSFTSSTVMDLLVWHPSGQRFPLAVYPDIASLRHQALSSGGQEQLRTVTEDERVRASRAHRLAVQPSPSRCATLNKDSVFLGFRHWHLPTQGLPPKSTAALCT